MAAARESWLAPVAAWRLVGAGLLLALAAAAQQPLGATFRTTASTGSRSALLGAPGIQVARFDHDDVVGWGRTTSTPNRRVIAGVDLEIEDRNASTAETFRIHVYTESPTAPGFPDLAAPLRSGPLQTTAVGAVGPARWTTQQLFTPPLEVPADRDVFVGVELAAAPNWPNDGLAVTCLLGATSTWPIADLPGAAPIQHGSYALAVPASGAAFYNGPRQLRIDLLTLAPGGAATSLSLQPAFPPSLTSPGGGGYLSGLHPDAVAPSRQSGRADTPGFTFLDTGLPVGSLVISLFDLGGFGPETPLAPLVPGSVGVFCLNASSVITGQWSPHTAAGTSFLVQVPSGLRPVLSGLPLLHQAIALHPNGSLRASPCVCQRF